jgi:hypothetical protein
VCSYLSAECLPAGFSAAINQPDMLWPTALLARLIAARPKLPTHVHWTIVSLAETF